jgi:hypothetical protein
VTQSLPAATFAGAPGSPYLVGGDPLALAGWASQVAASNSASGTVAAFSVASDGRLALAPGSPVPSGGRAPSGIAAFAGEQGHEIVVVADSSSNAASAFSDTGSGRLAPVHGSPVPAGGQMPSTVGGLRGKLIAVGSARSGTVSVLALSNAGLTGPIGPPIPTGLASISALAVGDFNGDGKPDLAVVDGSGVSAASVSILLGNGQGGFGIAPGSPFPSGGSGPGAIALEDFNDDGKMDLALVNSASSTLSVWLGNGDGSFRPAPGSPGPSGGSTPAAVVSGDLNGDGLADLAVINSGSGSLVVYSGNGAGSFTAQTQFPTWIGGAAPSAMISMDVNGDLRPDLIVANRQSQAIQVLLNTTVPPPVRLLRSQLRPNGTVRLKLMAPAAGTFSGALTAVAPRTHRAIRYGVASAFASRPGPVTTNVYPTRRGTRLFESVKVLHLQSKVSFRRQAPPNFADALLPQVGASTVRPPPVPRHRHAHRVIVHVSRLTVRAR